VAHNTIKVGLILIIVKPKFLHVSLAFEEASAWDPLLKALTHLETDSKHLYFFYRLANVART
jgi:hypothetical protein